MASPAPLLRPRAGSAKSAGQEATLERLLALELAASGNPELAVAHCKAMSELASSIGIELPKAPWDADRPRALRSLCCFCGCYVFMPMFENTFTLYANHLASELGASQTSINAAFTVFIMGLAFPGPIFARVCMNRGIRTCIGIGAVFCGLGYVGLVFCSSLWMLYASSFACGVACATSFSTCITSAIQLMPPAKQAPVASLVSVCYTSGSMLMANVVARLIRSYGLRTAYTFQGLVATGGWILCFVFCPPKTEDLRQKLQKLRRGEEDLSLDDLERLRDTSFDDDEAPSWAFWVLYACYLITAMVYYLFEAEVQQILEATQLATSPALVYTVPLCLLLNTVGRVFWGFVASRYRATVVMAASYLFITLWGNIWASLADSVLVSIAAPALCAFQATAFNVLMPVTIVRVYGAEQATLLTAYINTADGLASIGGAPAAVALANYWGWPNTLRLFSALPLPLACLLGLVAGQEAKALAKAAREA